MYLWLKALHIIAVIAWMAGLLYLSRLFVYHAAATPGSEQSETFKTMERRLYRFIMVPAMTVAWMVGVVLAIEGRWFASGWFIAKLVLVVAMTFLHGLLGHWMSEFAFDRNRHPQKFFRIVNEIPTALMIAIVALATVKPF
jgi:protoporphyrinogen IX oxidase